MPAYPSNILCAVDFSEQSAGAVRYAATLARFSKGGLTALHVHSTEPPIYFTAGMVPELEKESKSAAAKAAAALTHFVNREGAGLPFDIRVADGNLAEAILRTAAEIGADLIAMGTHGRTGLKRLMLGSVAESVLRDSPVPVLTVRDPQCAPITRILCDPAVSGTASALAAALGAECVKQTTPDLAEALRLENAGLAVIPRTGAAAVVRHIHCPVLSVRTENEIANALSNQVQQTTR
jgi:nucleotide-binding universal stress UspA family protein